MKAESKSDKVSEFHAIRLHHSASDGYRGITLPPARVFQMILGDLPRELFLSASLDLTVGYFDDSSLPQPV